MSRPAITVIASGCFVKTEKTQILKNTLQALVKFPNLNQPAQPMLKNNPLKGYKGVFQFKFPLPMQNHLMFVISTDL